MSCVVNFCKNRRERHHLEKGLRFYSFPKDPKQAVLWAKACRRWDMLKTGINKHRRICNQHFVTGKYSLNPTHPDYVPSIFPYNNKQEYTRIGDRVQRFVRRQKRAEARGAPFIRLFKQQQGPNVQKPGGSKDGLQQVQKPPPQQSGSSAQAQTDKLKLQPKVVLVHLPGYLNGQPPGELFYRVPPEPQPQQPNTQLQVAKTGRQQQGLYSQVELDDFAFHYKDHTYSKRPWTKPVERKPAEPQTPEVEDAPQSPEPSQSVTNAASKQTQQSEAENNPKDSQNKQKRLQPNDNQKDPLLCPICNRYYWSVVSFAAHVQRHADERFICKLCDKKFRHKFLLDNHMAVHTGEKPFSCSLCEKSYALKESLQAHVELHSAGFDCTYCYKPLKSKDAKEKHQVSCYARAEREGEGEPGPQIAPPQPPEPVRCAVCDKQFRWQRLLDTHMAIHTGEKPFKCPYCDRCYAIKKSMRSHMKVHLSGFDCTYCDKSFRTEIGLEQHLNYCKARRARDKEEGRPEPNVVIIRTPKPFQCSLCVKYFKKEKNLADHMNYHTGERPYQCTLCPKRFPTRPGLQKHIKRHTMEKKHGCPSCDKKFRDSSDLRSHIKEKHAEKTLQCEECGKLFATNSMLKNHAKIHARNSERPYSCSVCQQTFETLKAAEEHLLIHNKKRDETSDGSTEVSDISVKYSGAQFLCPDCGRTFFSNMSFRTHMRYFHTLERPFSCSICNLKFKRELLLTRHMKRHSGKNIVNFNCFVCQKTFRHKGSLTFHMMSHNGVKPFACTICKARFINNKRLQQHIEVKCTGQPFTCTMCPKQYKCRNLLNIHLRKIHKVGNHRCPYCGLVFMGDAGLHRHVSHKHLTLSNHGNQTPGTDRETESAVNTITLLQAAGPRVVTLPLPPLMQRNEERSEMSKPEGSGPSTIT